MELGPVDEPMFLLDLHTILPSLGWAEVVHEHHVDVVKREHVRLLLTPLVQILFVLLGEFGWVQFKWVVSGLHFECVTGAVGILDKRLRVVGFQFDDPPDNAFVQPFCQEGRYFETQQVVNGRHDHVGPCVLKNNRNVLEGGQCLHVFGDLDHSLVVRVGVRLRIWLLPFAVDLEAGLENGPLPVWRHLSVVVILGHVLNMGICWFAQVFVCHDLVVGLFSQNIILD